jgi:homogentisate 1,2-dioxygenase
MKVPFYHSNIDFDEVLFYHAGEFFSRAGIAPACSRSTRRASTTARSPRRRARTRDLTRTEEVAVMIDTRRRRSTPARRRGSRRAGRLLEVLAGEVR